MTVAPAHTSTKFRALPTGVGGSLWSARPRYGVFDFRDARLRIEVSDPEQVLFPTDCGLSLLAALRSASRPELAGRTALDIGCGSGIYTVALLSAGARHVTALDINPAAVEATRANVVNNGLDGAELVEARWFTAAELAARIADPAIGGPYRTDSIDRVLIQQWLADAAT